MIEEKREALAVAVSLILIFLFVYIFFQNTIGKFCLTDKDCFFDKCMGECKSNLIRECATDKSCGCSFFSCTTK